jgi:diadenosine tetraphosphate (Ap4A) HIT family hydrolase
MGEFALNQKLKNDCVVLGKIQSQLLLLMNNSLVPWFVIVPQTTRLEIHQLLEEEQAELYANVNLLSNYVMQNYAVDKLNVASIGNVVNQMHVHVIGRRRDDYCWPNVVWGRPERVEYKKEEVGEIVKALKAGLEDHFVELPD